MTRSITVPKTVAEKFVRRTLRIYYYLLTRYMDSVEQIVGNPLRVPQRHGAASFREALRLETLYAGMVSEQKRRLTGLDTQAKRNFDSIAQSAALAYANVLSGAVSELGTDEELRVKALADAILTRGLDKTIFEVLSATNEVIDRDRAGQGLNWILRA